MLREIPALKASMDSVRSKSEVKLLPYHFLRLSHEGHMLVTRTTYGR